MEKEPTLGTDHLLPYEKGAASPADAGSSFDDLAGALLGEAPTVEDEPAPEAEAEGEPDEVEEEAADSDESDDEVPDDSDDEEPESAPTYRVKVGGEEVEVPLDELIKGYSRTADYTRKTTEVANQRKALEAKEAAIAEKHDHQARMLSALEAALVEQTPKEPDWDKLRQENPTEFAAKFAEHQLHNDKLRAVRAEQDKVRAEQEATFHARRSAHLEAEHAKLVEAIPEWKDTEKATTEKGKLVEFAGSLGWTPGDLADVGDHRLVLLLRDAMLYRESQTKGKEAIREKVKAAPVLQPGGRPNKTNKAKRTEVQRKAERLEKSGRVDDAAALFEHLFEG